MGRTERKLALVTGASSGIGLEIAKQLATAGYDLAISGSSARIHEAAHALKTLGVEAYAYQADAGTYEGVEGFWKFVDALGRPVDCAALNVGVASGCAFKDNDLEVDLRVIAINVTGTVHIAKRVVQHMCSNGHGRILIVSSVSATTPAPFETTYGPSKAFGFSFAESLREELRDFNISVTALLPGATDSEFHRNAGMADTPVGKMKKNDKTLVARQGVNAMMMGIDHVVGDDAATGNVVVRNRTLSETEKARMHAAITRPTRS